MIHKTKGIVLRSVKYGETSLVVTLFTELLGLQSYLVNGVRTVSKNGITKAGLFQPASLLELEAYHHPFKNLQRLKEYRWGFLYQNILTDVRKNAIALYMMELLTKCLKQPEAHAELFYFVEDALQHLDQADARIAANFPLFFALHLPVFFGFRINDAPFSDARFLDLAEGQFTPQPPGHVHYLEDQEAAAVSQLLKTQHPHELEQIRLNQESRRRIMTGLEAYYALHIADFGSLRTVPVLRELMD